MCLLFLGTVGCCVHWKAKCVSVDNSFANVFDFFVRQVDPSQSKLVRVDMFLDFSKFNVN